MRNLATARAKGLALFHPGRIAKDHRLPHERQGRESRVSRLTKAAADEGPESAACAIWFRRPGPVVRIDSASLEKPPLVTRYPRVSFPGNKTSKSAVRSSREGLPRSSSERLRLLEAVENALEFLCPFGLALRLRILDVFVDKALDLAYSFF